MDKSRSVVQALIWYVGPRAKNTAASSRLPQYVGDVFTQSCLLCEVVN